MLTRPRGPNARWLPRTFWERVDRTGDCWIWLAGSLHGYGTTARGRAHREAWELTNGPIPAGLVVRHNCDTPLCVRPSHLTLGTVADNMRDKAIRERQPSKLSNEQVREIRRRRADGASLNRLAREYGVNPATISRIVNRLARQHVE